MTGSPRMRTLIVIAVLAVCMASGSTAAAQQYQLHHDIIRGRVTDDSGKVIAGADIAVTMAPDRATRFGKSDTAGRYEISFEHGTGDYLVHIASLGREAFRKRITRTGTDSVFT